VVVQPVADEVGSDEASGTCDEESHR
jgi:hypothetical protein